MWRRRSLELIWYNHMGSAHNMMGRQFHPIPILRALLVIDMVVFSNPSFQPAPPTTTFCSRRLTRMRANGPQSLKFEAGERCKGALQGQLKA